MNNESFKILSKSQHYTFIILFFVFYWTNKEKKLQSEKKTSHIRVRSEYNRMPRWK